MLGWYLSRRLPFFQIGSSHTVNLAFTLKEHVESVHERKRRFEGTEVSEEIAFGFAYQVNSYVSFK